MQPLDRRKPVTNSYRHCCWADRRISHTLDLLAKCWARFGNTPARARARRNFIMSDQLRDIRLTRGEIDCVAERADACADLTAPKIPAKRLSGAGCMTV